MIPWGVIEQPWHYLLLVRPSPHLEPLPIILIPTSYDPCTALLLSVTPLVSMVTSHCILTHEDLEQAPQMRKNTGPFSFWVWFTWFNIIFCRPVYLPISFMVSSFFTNKQYSIVSMYHISLPIHWRTLGCFPFLAVRYLSVSMIIAEQVSVE